MLNHAVAIGLIGLVLYGICTTWFLFFFKRESLRRLKAFDALAYLYGHPRPRTCAVDNWVLECSKFRQEDLNKNWMLTVEEPKNLRKVNDYLLADNNKLRHALINARDGLLVASQDMESLIEKIDSMTNTFTCTFARDAQERLREVSAVLTEDENNGH